MGVPKGVIKVHEIREQDPLKQGLKLIRGYTRELRTIHSRARSTKTRIETRYYDNYDTPIYLFASKIH